jgi:DNA adenine methylase
VKKISSLISYFGSNRTLAANVGAALAGCSHVVVPFAGSLAELQHIEASNIVASDINSNVINLARCVKDDTLRRRLISDLDRTPFHELELDEAQKRCKARGGEIVAEEVDYAAACDYFVTSWMGRSSVTGTKDEFHGRISSRWNSNGGSSGVRFRNATRSLVEWGRIMRRCEFRCLDCFAFLAKCQDASGSGIYCDPPFPDAGEVYRHPFNETDHRILAARLTAFTKTRVVARFYEHPLIEELYPPHEWTWNRYVGKKQSNAVGPEVLLVRN